MSEKKHGRVLVVDDEQSRRDLIVEVLEMDGHKTVTAESYEIAVEKLGSKTRFDIAVIDMRLVDKDEFNIQGIEVLKEAKRLQPSMKAIILTAYPDPKKREKAITYYRADGFYEKAPKGKPFI